MSHNLQKAHRANASKGRAPAPRYEVRWANGSWVIFDTHEYRIAERVIPNLQKSAIELLNAPAN
jgi:hypothetical protein